MPRIIYLIGYMACGKTTLGRAFRADEVADFVDLDEEIEKQSGMSPSQWFSERGEDAFREFELKILHHISPSDNRQPLIVATGGGTPCNAGAMDFMLENGLVIWLKASLNRTVARLLDADGQRPIVTGMDESALRKFIPEHLAARQHIYERAHLCFDSSRLDTSDEIAQTVASFKAILANHLID